MMKRKMKNKYFAGICIFFVICLSCDVEYDYNFENGFDTGEEPGNVSTDTTGFEVDKSMYESAQIFPGLVDDDERRIPDTIIVLDLDKNYIDNRVIDVKSTPKPIYSTGLFAPAGELIQVVVPPNVRGLKIQIGSHMDDLSNIMPARRDPLVYTVKELFPGNNFIRNPYGGYIWIWDKDISNGTTEINIKRAVKAPDFILGETNSITNWKEEVMSSSVPWFELRGEHISFTVPRTWVTRAIQSGDLEDIDVVLKTWDEIIVNDIYNFNGLIADSTDPALRAPEFPERLILDTQLEGGVYIHQNEQPIFAQNDRYWFNEWVDLNSIITGQSWGTLRALGSNYNPIYNSPWWGELETSMANIYAFQVADKEGTIPSLGNENGVHDIFPVAVEYAKRDGNYFTIDSEADDWVFQLTPFIQLFHQISNPETDQDGWAFYPYLLEQMKTNDLIPSDTYKRDFFYKTLSEYTQTDFAPFFDAWGIPLSDYIREDISKSFSPLNKALWEYNPVTGEGGNSDYNDYKIYINREDWSFYSAATEQSEGSLASLKDNDPRTFWHSCWSNCSDEIKNPPHTIDVNMGHKENVDGIMIASRINSHHPKSFEFYVSNNGYEWEYVDQFMMEDSNYKQFIDLPRKMNFQHFRLVFTEMAYNDTPFATLSELGAYSKG